PAGRTHVLTRPLSLPWRLRLHVLAQSHTDTGGGRRSRAVDSILDGSPKLVTIDEEAHDQIVHGGRFGEANCAADKSLNASPQIDVLALNFLGMLLAYYVLLRREMPLVGTPPIRVKPCDTKRRQQALEFKKDGILPPSKDIGQHLPTVLIYRMPEPSWIAFAVHVAPHLVEFRAEPATHRQRIRTPYLYLHMLWVEVPQHRLIHSLECRCLFLSSFMTGVGLTCNTRAVSRMPLAFMAISTICCLMAGD